jgi:hypothetical protein
LTCVNSPYFRWFSVFPVYPKKRGVILKIKLNRKDFLKKSDIATAALAIITLSFSSAVSAGSFTVFGLQTYDRGRGQPEIQQSEFSVISPNAPYYIELENGPGGATRVSSAVISINGVEVITPEDLNQEVGQVNKPVLLDGTNEIAVELRGIPFGTVSVKVIGVDTDPPMISATLSPEPNINGWNNTDVVVSFDCADAISGIAGCSDPVTVSFETDGYLVTGTATDNAGNAADTSVTVSLDKTVPTITRTWPPADEFSTDRASISIEGSAVDGLSGVDKVELLYAQGTVPIGDTDFMGVGELDTDIIAGERWTENAFVLRATDPAGNRVEQSFLVRHTQMTHTLPTDPARTELEEGLLTSVDRAMVRFGPSISRENIHDIVGQEGGRVVGFLPATNTAIVQFETDQVVALKNVLSSLKSRTEVDVAVPAIFLPEIQFDNELLSSVESASYDNILSSLASQFIIDNGFSLYPVNIAVIETGMDDSHGLNNEFADIIFYDLCTPEGQAGVPGTPVDVENTFTKSHGTKITGIVAGANNDNGNNGVIRGIPGSQFGVHVFRMNCGGGNDPHLVGTAMDLIIGGTLADFDVVNMSFGAIFSDLTMREDIRAIYEGYFDSPTGRKILWVGGSGNDNVQIACNEFLPSGLACDLDNVVSVGAYNASDLLRGQWVNSEGDLLGSNWGEGVTINAPGTGVWTATDPGTYGGVSGTSASTPLVTGAAGVMIAVNSLNPYFVKQLLVSEAQLLADNMLLPEGGLNMLALLQAGEIPRMIMNGLQYLRGQQNADGSYSLPPGGLTPEEKSVEATAMAALAFSQYGIDESDPDLRDALDWILSQQNADGSISNEGQRFPPKTLDTAFAVLALSATRNPQYYGVVQTATAYIAQVQHDEDTGHASNHPFYGGWTHFYPNYVPPGIVDWYSLPVLEPPTATALLALHFAERFNNADTIVPADVITKAETFVTRCQNYAATNPDFNYKICFDDVCYYDDGGFARYPPGSGGPWAELLGRDSYAGATAAALWSLYAAGVDRLDPRVEPAQVWLGDGLVSGPPNDNYPQGDRDYYHFLYYLALAGTAWDWDKYELGDHLGEQIDWYQQIADALADRQHPDGHWEGSSWETDVVATALAVLALESKWTPPGIGLRFRE